MIIDVYLHKAAVLKTEEDLYREKGVPSSCNLFYKESMLDFKDTIDWKQRRYEVAKDMMAALGSNIKTPFSYQDGGLLAKCATEFADELISQLKEQQHERR